MIKALAKYHIKKWHFWSLLLFFIVGVFHSFIANENYLICFDSGQHTVDTNCQSGIPSLIPYGANTIDKLNRGKGPFDAQNVSLLYYRHWLGTDHLGRDVMAGLIHGSYTALRIGVGAMLLTILIGTFFGFLSGYIGDKGFKLSRLQLVLYLVCVAFCSFYFFYGSALGKVFSLLLFLVATFISIKLSSSENKKYLALPLDLMIMRFIEIFRSIPTLFIILVLIGIVSKPSITVVIFIIAIVRWPSVTRFIRAEILKIKEEPFIESARALGLSKFKIFRDHVLPLSLSPVIIASAFGVSTAILLESTLSFLGIGIPIDQVTWGSMLNNARSNFGLWWLAFFPGLLIYFTIFLFNSIGDSITQNLRAGNRH